MTINTLKTVILSEISEKGYTQIKFPASKDFETLVGSLGEIIQRTEIRVSPNKSGRLVASNRAMAFHTDHNEAKFVAWFCRNQSSMGGHTLLLDSRELLNFFSEKSKQALSEITVKTHNVFYGDKLSIPLLNLSSNNPTIYYAPWLVNNPGFSHHRSVLAKLENQLSLFDPIKILLSEGDLLIVDNHRMLHGREAFPEKSGRWLTRFWIR